MRSMENYLYEDLKRLSITALITGVVIMLLAIVQQRTKAIDSAETLRPGESTKWPTEAVPTE